MVTEREPFIVMYNKTVWHVKTEPLPNSRLLKKKERNMKKWPWNWIFITRKESINYLFLRGVFDSWTSRDYKLVTALVYNTSAN